MLADAFNCLGFTWASSPACTGTHFVEFIFLRLLLIFDRFLLLVPISHRTGGHCYGLAGEGDQPAKWFYE